MDPRKLRPALLALMAASLIATAACDKIKAAYCTQVLPALENICIAQPPDKP